MMIIWKPTQNLTLLRVIYFLCRTSSGKLHLAHEVGKISLADCRLIEDPNDKDDENNQGDMDNQDRNNEGVYYSLS